MSCPNYKSIFPPFTGTVCSVADKEILVNDRLVSDYML